MASQQQMTLQDLLDQMATLSATVADLRDEVADLRAERNRNVRGGMYDKKTWEPDKLLKITDFRDWSEDFYEYIDQCDEQLSDMLNVARDSQSPITSLGRDHETIAKAKVLYRTLKRYIVNPDAKSIVVHIQDKNPYEAWRLLFVNMTRGTIIRPRRLLRKSTTSASGTARSSRTCRRLSRGGRTCSASTLHARAKKL